ncbi:pyruvate dehydrogenase (acetyl-transferring) E1 component subunit alpha [Sciscionella sediminilitoris]|uniref:pyruvate dehydrogenase (acetyl-transferring) E1 component subunit alpha n=1 Tax=Sciscionella sediminilitoris TaxID=1445613 RepID=UPI0004DF5A1D|nr:pyruvate dehydrogenase (acetyl-transferring) E1 component subunit alpha [Sciscionella sp. SE31]
MTEIVRLLDTDGTVLDHERHAFPEPERLLEQYRGLVLGRRFNEQANSLVRQGKLAVYPSSRGQEACQIGAAEALREGDWLFPTYRDTVAVVQRGVPPVEALTLLTGDWHCGYDPLAHRVAPQATPLATQLPHAVGVGHAARLRGEDTVVLALCGDGATSEGDFHEALNFAAVFTSPVVFLVQNNKYAISVPLSRQTAAESLADKGIGYGMPAVLVDGNDPAAVTAVLDEAVARAASGNGPTLVEADTYRLEAHTNADDAGRYRSEREVAEWTERDPLPRLRAYLRGTGLLGPAREAELEEAAEELASHVRQGVSALTPPEPGALFTEVYGTATQRLATQAALLDTELHAGAGVR